ncbi:MAG: tRNA uridine-5-carboxymethylaminomethyl(34) synthesis GTPase MnmE [Gemmatimonadota bacterium]|nr:tRNA uridine-5-carboxymethylaminomethyl(34) synthesis GTPase MnmE [Gemmatimonadota bacterium]
MDIDTIAALSTAPGLGAIAIVRISGPDAFRLFETLAPEEGGDRPKARVATLVKLVDPDEGNVLDHALVTCFPGPDSYTGEDVVEISCHGGTLVPQLVLDACLRAGARDAEPGEFTRRAYLHGRMDLVQAEAVGDVIHARSRALHRAAVGQLDRGLSERVGALRRAMLGLEAQLAHHIDFPEEDDPPVPLEGIRAEAEALAGRLEHMLATAPEGELLREGALVVLAGLPNVGKSSLYNAMLGRERAIVTEQPGTTRDALEAEIELGGFPFRVVDTAGLRDTEERIERLGIEVTRRYLDGADVILLCVEAGGGMGASEKAFLEEHAERNVLVVETKADAAAPGDGDMGSQAPASAGQVPIRVSAKTGEGLDALREGLLGLVFGGLVSASPEVPVITRRRHARALGEALEAVREFGKALDAGVPPEMASAHLRSGESALEDVLGVISTDDVLDVVFRDFCVGK